MYKNDYTKIILDRSLPDFIRNDAPMFEAFLKAYYEWMQETKSSIDIAKNLINYRDVDATLDEFVDYIRKEKLVNIPAEILADKRLLAKHIKDFYRQKGTEESYKFIFRLLYNDDVTFYYPKDDILRASDGKWEQINSIKISRPVMDDFNLLGGGMVVGLTSTASAYINLVIATENRGVEILELYLEKINGSFLPDEQVSLTYFEEDGDERMVMSTVKNVYGEIDIIVSGGEYEVSTMVPIKDETNVNVGLGVITKVTKGPITSISIVDGGHNYRGRVNKIDDFAHLPINSTWEGIYLPDATIEAQDSDDFDFASSPISFPIDTVMYLHAGDPIIFVDSTNSFGVNASGIVQETLNGVITVIELLTEGTGYEKPTAIVVSENGTGANISTEVASGSIVTAKILQFPLYLETDTEDTLTVDFTQYGNGLAEGKVINNYGLIQYPGYWANTDGLLSSDKVLQDNVYYQDFSYVILSAIPFTKWKDIVGKIIHPAGLMQFGIVSLTAEFELGSPFFIQTYQTFDRGILIQLADGGDLMLEEGGYLMLAETFDANTL